MNLKNHYGLLCPFEFSSMSVRTRGKCSPFSPSCVIIYEAASYTVTQLLTINYSRPIKNNSFSRIEGLVPLYNFNEFIDMALPLIQKRRPHKVFLSLCHCRALRWKQFLQHVFEASPLTCCYRLNSPPLI